LRRLFFSDSSSPEKQPKKALKVGIPLRLERQVAAPGAELRRTFAPDFDENHRQMKVFS